MKLEIITEGSEIVTSPEIVISPEEIVTSRDENTENITSQDQITEEGLVEMVERVTPEWTRDEEGSDDVGGGKISTLQLREHASRIFLRLAVPSVTSLLHYNFRAVGSTHPTRVARPFSYSKWIDLCSLLLAAFTAGINITSLQIPFQSALQLHNRKMSLIFLSLGLCILTGVKIWIQLKKDRAGFFHYHVGRRESGTTFYPKCFVHLIIILVTVSTVIGAAFSYLTSKYNQGMYIAYYVSISSIAVSFLHTAWLLYVKPTKPTLTRVTSTGMVFDKLEECEYATPEDGEELFQLARE